MQVSHSRNGAGDSGKARAGVRQIGRRVPNACMHLAKAAERDDDWPRSSVCLVEVAVSAIGVGLEKPGIGRQMPVRMTAQCAASFAMRERRSRRNF